eukprot:249842-Hanusia_phi.AAC.1
MRRVLPACVRRAQDHCCSQSLARLLCSPCCLRLVNLEQHVLSVHQMLVAKLQQGIALGRQASDTQGSGLGAAGADVSRCMEESKGRVANKKHGVSHDPGRVSAAEEGMASEPLPPVGA